MLALDGVVNQEKAEIIARATAVLTPEEARAAEALVLGRAGRLTPRGLRSAIARAVIQVAPDKARKRREKGSGGRRCRGNAGLAGRELPPAQVLAADQKITAWARQLKKAGLEGGMDELRARAYMDMPLGTDSRPRQDNPGQGNPGRDGGGGAGRAPGGALGAIPAGFAGKVNLIVTLATLLELADRPGEIPGIGPIDPWVVRSPRTQESAETTGETPATRSEGRPRSTVWNRSQGRPGVRLHGHRPARPAGRIRHLAAADRGQRRSAVQALKTQMRRTQRNGSMTRRPAGG